MRREDDGRIPKDILYGELPSGKRSTGRPKLRYEDVCKRDIKAMGINMENLEEVSSDRSVLQKLQKFGEE